MAAKKKINTAIAEPHTEEKKNVYKTFDELSEIEMDNLVFYETFCAEVNEHYQRGFTKEEIKSKYGNCIFPPFVLNMMSHIRKNK